VIPKIIHYCWFGGNTLPKLAEKCIKSWKKYCKGYEIKEWNEQTFDIASAPLYVRQAYEAKKWAFVTDYVRLQVVYEHGGIYMDTDVELKKKLDELLNHSGYFGFEDGLHINTGLGFGGEKGLPILKELMDDYDGIPFRREDGSFDLEACPKRNTRVFLRHGLLQDDSKQILDGDILILPSIYLCPICCETGFYSRSLKTVSVHHFSASWFTEEQRFRANKLKAQYRKLRRRHRINYITHLPNRILLTILDEEKYQSIKRKLKQR